MSVSLVSDGLRSKRAAVATVTRVATAGQDIVIAGFLALDVDERAVAFERIRDLWREHLASQQTDEARFLRSLVLVADANDGVMPTVQEYQRIESELAACGVTVEPFRRVYEHYGNWPNARAAFGMSGDSSPELVEFHFRRRRLGKTSRYTEKTLIETMGRAVSHWGRPPTTREYEWWRKRQLSLRNLNGVAGPDQAIPTHLVYTNRWRSWDGALQACGCTQEQIASRMEAKEPAKTKVAVPFLPDGLPIACVHRARLADAPLPIPMAELLADAFEQLPQRARYVLTVRLGLGGTPVRTLRKTGEPLVVSLARAQQIQVEAMDVLVTAVTGQAQANGTTAAQTRERIVQTLAAITVTRDQP